MHVCDSGLISNSHYATRVTIVRDCFYQASPPRAQDPAGGAICYTAIPRSYLRSTITALGSCHERCTRHCLRMYLLLDRLLGGTDSLQSWLMYLTAGCWKLDIVIPEQYPMVPPTVKFITPICHPNVNFKVRRAHALRFVSPETYC